LCVVCCVLCVVCCVLCVGVAAVAVAVAVAVCFMSVARCCWHTSEEQADALLALVDTAWEYRLPEVDEVSPDELASARVRVLLRVVRLRLLALHACFLSVDV
jgi:hypothetical protein